MNSIKIIGIIGSPRKRMNTEICVQQVLEGTKNKGAEVEIIYLNSLSIKPCQACKVQDGRGCVFHDDMDILYRCFEEADGLVIGTPVYYHAVASQIKLMIDRSYCLAKPIVLPSGQKYYQTSVQKRKRGILLSIANHIQHARDVFPTFSGWAPEVNINIIEQIAVGSNESSTPIIERKEFLDSLFSLGASLVDSILKMSVPNLDTP